MYILDKNKDYYDYLSSPNMYGTDKKVVYDRRGSEVTTDEILTKMVYLPIRSFSKLGYFFLLEIGFKQYIIEVKDIKFREEWMRDNEFVSCTFENVYTFNNSNQKHYYPEAAISIREVDLYEVWTTKGRVFKYKFDETNMYSFYDVISKVSENNIINNPILKSTSLTTLFSPEEIWIEVQTYLSSLNNDQDRETDLTDEERAEKHGFDRKTSFRNPIK